MGINDITTLSHHPYILCHFATTYTSMLCVCCVQRRVVEGSGVGRGIVSTAQSESFKTGMHRMHENILHSLKLPLMLNTAWQLTRDLAYYLFLHKANSTLVEIIMFHMSRLFLSSCFTCKLKNLTNIISCIRVGRLSCRDGADAQYMQYLSKSRVTSLQIR